MTEQVRGGPVDHPKHYNFGKYEVIEVIRDWKLSFCLGNVVKYIARAGKKDDKLIEDLEKAKWYLEYEIATLKAEKASAAEGDRAPSTNSDGTR